MSRRREFFGNTLEDALDAASQGLETPVEQIDYDMLDEGRKGVFGLGVRQVRISAVVPEKAPAVEKQPAPGGGELRGEGGGQKRRAAGPARSERKGRSGGGERKPRSRRGQRRQGSGSRPRPKPRRDDEPEAAEVKPQHREIEQTLQRIFELMQLDVTCTARKSNSSARLDLDGRDRKMLLSRDAQLLGSIQFLLNRMSRRAWPESGRIQLHCDGFRNPRDEDLVELVREVAEQVRSTGESKQLEPMNPYERRLAHLTVREYSDLDSNSDDGDGFLKRITVSRQS